MIKFNVNKNGVYLSKDGHTEFKKYVMTTDELVNAVITSVDTPINTPENKIKLRRQWLRTFFNDPNRMSLQMSLGTFTDLNYGYGVVDDKLKMIVMWVDDNGLLNFASWYDKQPDNQYKGSFIGSFVKIVVTDGDVFIKNRKEAESYRVNMETLSNMKKEEIAKEKENALKEKEIWKHDKQDSIDKMKEEVASIDAKLKSTKNELTELSRLWTDCIKERTQLCIKKSKLEWDIYKQETELKNGKDF